MFLVLVLAVLVHHCGAVKIVVSGLKPTTTDSDLTSIFGAFGTVENAYVNKDPVTGQSQMTGGVTMSDLAQAQQAVRRLLTFSASIVAVLPRVDPPGLRQAPTRTPR